MSFSQFFLITLPGFEDLALKEVHSWIPEAEARIEHGGIDLTLPLKEGLALNTVLKLPTRILLRAYEFKCKDFPKLYNKTSLFSWSDLLDTRHPIKVHASSKKSRLSIKRRIEDTVEKAWVSAQKKKLSLEEINEGQRLPPIDLYVRFFEDTCTISIDTSGERLHKRNLNKHVGKAPLRETLAAGMIHLLKSHSSLDKPLEIIDPMMGSGTMLMEAALLDFPRPRKEYAFSYFKMNQLAELNSPSKKLKVARIGGYEKDLNTFEAAKHNLSELSNIELSLQNEDFFKSLSFASPQPDQERWVLCNPPYGKRIKIQTSLKEYYDKLIKKIDDSLSPKFTTLLLPREKGEIKLSLPKSWKVIEKRKLLNGGIPVTVFVFEKTV